MRLGPTSPGSEGEGGVPSFSSRGAPPQLHRLPAPGHPFSPGKFVESLSGALPHAHKQPEGARHSTLPPQNPPPTARTWPPSLSPTWMYAIFALAHSLQPGHGAATATLPSPTWEGEEGKEGKGIKSQPGGPRRDWSG